MSTESTTENDRVGRADTIYASIYAGTTVAELVRTTLGPFGRSKLMVDDLGRFTVSKNGFTVLDAVEFVHPIADLIEEVAESQWDQHKDGTTMATVLTGRLQEEAKPLIESGIHPTTIYEGYNFASKIADTVLAAHEIEVDVTDRKLLTDIARSSLAGNGIEEYEGLADTLVEAVAGLASRNVDPEKYLTFETVVGGPVDNTSLVHGLVIHQKPGHHEMPTQLNDARVALIDSPIGTRTTKTKPTVSEMGVASALNQTKKQQLQDMADKIIQSGATVVLCHEEIDHIAYNYLSERGIFSLRHTDEADLNHVATATGATRVSNLSDLNAETLGDADRVEQRTVADKEFTVIDTGDDQMGATVMVCATMESNIDQLENALRSTISDLTRAIESGVVPGAGAIEMEIAREVRNRATNLTDRKQLAVKAYANAIETIPKTLATNAGHNSLDALATLNTSHHNGEMAGVTLPDGEIQDVLTVGVYDPITVKSDALSRATETATKILRTNEIIYTS